MATWLYLSALTFAGSQTIHQPAGNWKLNHTFLYLPQALTLGPREVVVDSNMAVTQQCSADIGRRRGVDGSAQLLLRRDSSVVRALVRITRGPGFEPQLCCLNFFRFSVPMSVLSFDGNKKNGLIDVYVHCQDRLSDRYLKSGPTFPSALYNSCQKKLTAAHPLFELSHLRRPRCSLP